MSACLVDLALFDDSGLVSRSDICLVRADSTARVRSQVFNLADMTTCTLATSIFDIIQYDSRYVVRLFSATSGTLSDRRFDKLVLLDEEAAASLRGGERLT